MNRKQENKQHIQVRLPAIEKQLEESQEFNRKVLELLPNTVYVYDFSKAENIFANRHIFRSSGYTQEEIAAMGQVPEKELIHFEDLVKLRQHWCDIHNAADGEVLECAYRLKHKSGKWTHQLSRCLVFKRDEAGNVQQFLGVTTDISELCKASELLMSKNLELENNNAALASFSYMASHDLQEPLRKIRTFSKLIMQSEDKDLPPVVKNYLNRISVSTTRMQSLIDDLLDYSKTSSEELQFEQVDLTAIVREVTANLQESMDEKGACVQVGQLPVLPVLPVQIRQLFENLIGNALKYSRPMTAPEIHISAAAVSGEEAQISDDDGEKQYVKITVSDNGIGFEQENADKIFDLFTRLHGREEYAGTGIGLAICKKIMLNHKGWIEAVGTPGAGAVFNLYFPTVFNE